MLIAIFSAFLGGLILNFMPCVFPIISFKIMGLLRHIHDKKRLRAEGLAFMVGVVLSMLALTGFLLILRSGGEAIGWGFQLQSPKMVTLLALVMLGSALNLSGLFEAGLRLQQIGQNQNSTSGIYGAALTGALAIIVATPCTAPFMASAIGYASIQSPIVALSIFLSLAIGFAAPFTLLSFSPNLAEKLPKPGAWMETLKQFLAFPMYAAAAWLIWVASQQTDATGLAIILICCVSFAMVCWLYGMAQKRTLMGQKSLGLYVIAFAMSLMILFLIFQPNSALQTTSKTVQNTALTTEATMTKPTKMTWSPHALAEARKQHRPIFIDFSASWCITCQVNDKNVISTDDVQKTILDTNTVFMFADATNYNAEIVKAMADYGRDGLPLYILYPANGSDPIILPQILSKSSFIMELEKATKQ